jgi:hypothetical protein
MTDREKLDGLWNIALHELCDELTMNRVDFISLREADRSIAVAAERKKWIKALEAEMVSCHLGVFNAEDDPKTALAKLLAWHQGVALDPTVSSGAQNLILEEREACAKVCDGIRYSGYVPPEDGAAASYYDDAASECAATIRARNGK